MKEEHVNETKEEINSIKRQIFWGCIRGGAGTAKAPAPRSRAAPVATEAASRAVPAAAAARWWRNTAGGAGRISEV